MNYSLRYALLTIGDSGVGKTSLLLRFAEDKFKDMEISTIGVDFKVKTVDIDGERVKLQMWDTAGQEKYRTITNSYYRNAQGVILVYDVTCRESFANVRIWLSEINTHAAESISIMIIGNKSDREEDRKITFQEGESFAQRNGALFLETSAKTNTNVEEAFIKLARRIKYNNVSEAPRNSNHRLLESSIKQHQPKSKCC